MKTQDTKIEFVKMRAENKSYQVIADTLNISKSTCATWEKELADEIAELKRNQLEELYDTYYMTKESRIRRLGDTLSKIDTAIENIDFSDMSPERLLDYKLKYTEALKSEYIDTTSPSMLEKRQEDYNKMIQQKLQGGKGKYVIQTNKR